MPRLEIALLGPPEIRLDGSPVETDRRKAIALLAYLAVTGRSQTRDHLAGLLWPDYNRDSAYAYLRRTLWELNQMLGKGWVAADRERLSLTTGPELGLDTADFQRSIHTLPERAAALYRGDFLSGFNLVDSAPFEDWQFQQVEYYRRQLAKVLAELAHTHAQAGEHQLALPYVRRWLELDVLDEAAHRAVMGLLAGMGDRTGAIRQYETCRQVLKDELGIEPQPETTELYQAILRGESVETRQAKRSADPDDSTDSRAIVPALRLPVMPTPFIGRRPEVEQIKFLVNQPSLRLITLVGPGGAGKTRLSIQVASELEDFFPHGVCFTALASVQSPEALVSAVSKALDLAFHREEPPFEQLLDYLRGKKLLLILDNFEHLLEASAVLVEILANAPGIKLLVTSRVRLNVQGEQLFPVGGMLIPKAGEIAAWEAPEAQAKPFSAVQLFLDRARRVQPGFTLTKQNCEPVIEICRQVQGMPLGLELAAAWLELLSPSEIATEIARSLDFLATNQVDVSDRQRSIRAVFESSWSLLSDPERAAFLKLCVFVGSFSSEAARQVSGASLQTLLGLANKSWLQALQAGRFQLHELLRQYGLKRLQADPGAWRDACNRHSAYFIGFTARQSLAMRSRDQVSGMAAFQEEFATNVKSTWEWLVTERRWEEILEPMALALFQFGKIREQMGEMIPWLRQARNSLSTAESPEEWLALAVLSTLEIYCEENESIKDDNPIERLASTWRYVAQHRLAEAMGIWFILLAGLVLVRNLDPEAGQALERAIDRMRTQNDPWALGISLVIQSNGMGEYFFDEENLFEAARIFNELGVLYEQGVVAEMLGRIAIQRKRPLAEIMACFQRARMFFAKMGAEFRQAVINFLYLAGMHFREGQIEQGFNLHHEAQRILERIGHSRLLVVSYQWESLAALRYDTFEHALALRLRIQEMARRLNTQSDQAWNLFELAEIYRVFGERQQAIEYYEQARSGFETMHITLGLGYYQRAYGDLALQEASYARALERYQSFSEFAAQDNHRWSVQQAHAKLALAYAYLNDLEAARLEIGVALDEMHAVGEIDLELLTLLAETICLIQEGKFEQAAGLAAFIARHPVSWNETKQRAQAILESACQAMSPEAAQAAVERGGELDLGAIVAEWMQAYLAK